MTASVDDTATLGENNAENKVSELFVTFVCENCDKTEDEAKLECCEICSRNKDDKGSRTLCQDCGRASHTKKSHNFGDQTRVVRGWSHKKVEIEQEKQVSVLLFTILILESDYDQCFPWHQNFVKNNKNISFD